MGTTPGIVQQILDWKAPLDEEYQGWLLFFASITALWIFSLPCYCAGSHSIWARRLASAMQAHVLMWFVAALAFNLAVMALLIRWMPNWTFSDYAKCVVHAILWMAKNGMAYSMSIALLIMAFFAFVFKERVAVILGIDHHYLVRFKFRDLLHCLKGSSRFKAIRLNVYKVEDLPSSYFLANNLYVEFFLGYNQPVKTRVHSNAGSGCIIKESVQLNYDENDDGDSLLIFVKNQKALYTHVLARKEIPADQLRKLVRGEQAQLGPPNWEPEHFQEQDALRLISQGKLWLTVTLVTDEP